MVRSLMSQVNNFFETANKIKYPITLDYIDWINRIEKRICSVMEESVTAHCWIEYNTCRGLMASVICWKNAQKMEVYEEAARLIMLIARCSREIQRCYLQQQIRDAAASIGKLGDAESAKSWLEIAR